MRQMSLHSWQGACGRTGCCCPQAAWHGSAWAAVLSAASVPAGMCCRSLWAQSCLPGRWAGTPPHSAPGIWQTVGTGEAVAPAHSTPAVSSWGVRGSRVLGSWPLHLGCLLHRPRDHQAGLWVWKLQVAFFFSLSFC